MPSLLAGHLVSSGRSCLSVSGAERMHTVVLLQLPGAVVVRASIPSNSLRLPESRLDNYGLRRTRTHGISSRGHAFSRSHARAQALLARHARTCRPRKAF